MICVKVGAITNRLRNSAMPTSTWLGGIEGVPSAFRTKPSTMMIRVKLVIMIRIDGARLSTVSSARSWSEVETSPSLPLRSRLMPAGAAEATAGQSDAGERHDQRREQEAAAQPAAAAGARRRRQGRDDPLAQGRQGARRPGRRQRDHSAGSSWRAGARRGWRRSAAGRGRRRARGRPWRPRARPSGGTKPEPGRPGSSIPAASSAPMRATTLTLLVGGADQDDLLADPHEVERARWARGTWWRRRRSATTPRSSRAG